ncbi:MAG: trypsin-like serine protease [Oscillospiraceae bacterium]|nr:trypsin-like serine protease [Oscillospiraceae bacterium]
MSFDEYDQQERREEEPREPDGEADGWGQGELNPSASTANILHSEEESLSAGRQNAEKPFIPEAFSWEDVEPPRRKKQAKEKREKSPGNNRGLKIFSVAVSCVLVATLTVLGFVVANTWGLAEAPAQGSSASEKSYPDREGSLSLVIGQTPENTYSAVTDGPLSVPQVAAKVKPSVVGVVTYTKESGLKAAGEGSGIIMTSDGYIITNEHVIRGAEAIKIVLENGDEFEASVVGADSKADLAVVKIEKENLTAAEFGDSTKLVTGETVIAIGNPGGLKYAGSVTQGIVSATNRLVASSKDSGYTVACIQTDAAINPGNSGGALVNVYGQVVGINSSKIVATGYEGIGFSISINEAKPIIDDLLAFGYVKDRVKIGITVTPIDEVLAKMYGIPEGLRIVLIEETSDALQKGLQVGDIITKVDGTLMTGFGDLSSILKEKKAGDSITLDVYRQISDSTGRTFSATLKLQEDRGAQSTPQSSNE